MQTGYEVLKGYEGYRSGSTRRTNCRKLLYSSLLIVGGLACSSFYVFPRRNQVGFCNQSPQAETILHGSLTLQEPLQQCAASKPRPAEPPATVNLWASLTINETVSVHEWLTQASRGLNLTAADRASLSDNSIYHIEVYRPAKDDALAYLTSPSEDKFPRRYSRVSLHLGGRPQAEGGPVIKDYLVGPLPIDGETVIKELTEIYHREDIPFNARGFGGIPFVELPHLLATYMPRIARVTQDLFDGVALGLDNDTLSASASGPYSFDGTFRRTWIAWRKNVAGPWLHPINFFQYVDISGTDPKQWKVLKIFATIDDFLDAYHNGTLRRLPDRPDQRKDTAWSTRYRPDRAPRDLDHLPGPRQVSFAGLRFRVNRELQYISWMGWGMYLGFDRDMGLSLWDIRFMNERLIYELSPQEAMAQYAGNDPMQGGTAWLDRYFGLGFAVRDLLPGYDCPYEAVYLPATTYTSLGMIARERAICVFEHDTARPITRHTGWHEGEFGAVRGYVLTVRSISTVGNYDYMFSDMLPRRLHYLPVFDYMFMTDGTIEVRVSASGYLQGGFWEAKQAGYGTAIRDTTMGSLHDHVINFKVDLDVGGLENSLLYTHTHQEEIEQPWYDDDDWGKTVIQQKITREIIDNEDNAKLKYPVNFQGGYAFVNQDKKNKWDNARGYAIHPGYSPIYNTVVGSKRILNSANWARYNLAVSRRKDTEPSSSSMWNMNLPGKPVVDFHKFFDGENITQKDLVAWVNVGMHHIPQAEDAPNTRTNVAASSFMLTPLNYFDSDISIDSLNAILLSSPTKPGDPYAYNDYGVRPAQCFPHEIPSFEYRGLKTYGLDGHAMSAASAEQMRDAAELFHRIKLKL
ncbi:amine oxidase catalytic domain-containing protein [Cytidiella melzeri]|nr:amine oxidase catalytic domain-containing protein [Cytidiella melzeri]